MSFVVSSVKERPSARYSKVGRLLPGDDGYIRVIRDGIGEILTFHKADLVIILGGMAFEGIFISDSGNRLIITTPNGQEYMILTKQVRTMLADWPKKKAAVFVIE